MKKCYDPEPIDMEYTVDSSSGSLLDNPSINPLIEQNTKLSKELSITKLRLGWCEQSLFELVLNNRECTKKLSEENTRLKNLLTKAAKKWKFFCQELDLLEEEVERLREKSKPKKKVPGKGKVNKRK